MSINDLLNDDTFLPAMLVIFVLVMIIAIPVGIARARETNVSIYGGNDYAMEKHNTYAKVVARRSSPHPLTPTVMVNVAVFEMENGSRVELAIKDPAIYSIIVEGDSGLLTYQGKRFISFERGEKQ